MTLWRLVEEVELQMMTSRSEVQIQTDLKRRKCGEILTLNKVAYHNDWQSGNITKYGNFDQQQQ